MRTFQGIKAFGYRKEGIFKIKTSIGDVFMSVSRSNYLNEERAVVEVDRARFFELWQKEPSSIHRAQAYGNGDAWRGDSKFANAEKGFSHGEKNPVPLAEVSCLVKRYSEQVTDRRWLLFRRHVEERQLQFPYVAFTNGVTRVIWLAAHAAERFPVECHIGHAAQLQQLAGAEGSRWMTVAELVPADSNDFQYDQRFELELGGKNDPLRLLLDRLKQARQLLKLEADPEAKGFVEKLVYGSAIGALESFLWETAHYWVTEDDTVLRDVVSNVQVFRDETIKLSDIFHRHNGLREHVLAYLQNLVWHRWEKVAPLFKLGLGIKLPSFKPFEDALVKRHDIVHRSGRTIAGEPVVLTENEIDNLFREIEQFATEVDRLLAARTCPS